MPNDYAYSIAQCDVPTERRAALQSYRDKRRLWLSWISTDEHHAIWTVLSSMVWTDVAFKTVTNFAVGDEANALNNHLMVEALLDGHVATQVLAIRRLVDDGNSDIISLRRLVKDVRRNFVLFTRENYVCFDGLPYDYEAVQRAQFIENAGKWGNGGIWMPTSGPQADGTSEIAHRQFDRLAGIDPVKRTREDRLPAALLTTIEKWLDDSGADDLAKWSHAYLAHAGGPESRKRIADLMVTTNKIADAIRALARVTEAISAWLLFAGGRSNALMPVAQFNPFERLDKPIMQPGGEAAAYKLWHQLSDERNSYLDGVDTALIGKPKATGPLTMKYPVTRFKSLAVALKELEPFIRNGEHLQTGKPFEKFGGMRSREILANWLLCVAINLTDDRELTFSSDPVGGDGIICDSATGETWPTEHVMVPRLRPGETGDAEALILKAIEHKRSKGGTAYAAGKTLIVFLEAGAGPWFPNKVARQLPDPLLFAAVWVVGLQGVEAGEYVYNVTCLDVSEGDAPALLVQLGKDFDKWTVKRIQ